MTIPQRVRCPNCRRLVTYNPLGAVDVENRPVLNWHYTNSEDFIECPMSGHSQHDEYYLNLTTGRKP